MGSSFSDRAQGSGRGERMFRSSGHSRARHAPAPLHRCAPSRASTSPDRRGAVNGLPMADTLQPRDAKDVEAAVQWVLGESKGTEIVGHRSESVICRPGPNHLTLELSALRPITLYE